MDTRLDLAFVKNRAEEIGYDVWSQFVIPPFFDRLDLHTARKPSVVVGGRGCGKTMLLRYLSHQSAFSVSRTSIPDQCAERIGLYWKADTQFAHTLTRRGVPDEIWESAFEHAMALRLADELLSSLNSMARSTFSAVTPQRVSALSFSELGDFLPDFRGDYDSVSHALRSHWRRLRMWVNNPRTATQPGFLPVREFLITLIDEIRSQVSPVHSAVFMVYIDEYENLCEYQRRIINTHLKHSEPPLVFNVAAKRNSFVDRRTIGTESITDIADYRTLDIEELIGDDFPVFAAEILFLNLAMTSSTEMVPMDVLDLRDPAALERRRSPGYRERVLSKAQCLLPSMDTSQLAAQAVADKTVRNRLESELRSALERRASCLKPSDFIRHDHPQASIVCTALLHRDTLTPEGIKEELDRLAAGEGSRFGAPTDWIHNNFLGCLLRLYNLSWKVCPCYGGFDSFCLLSRGNLRHFLELCHKSAKLRKTSAESKDLAIEPRDQALAALQASSAFLREVRSFGPHGNALHTFVLTLGSLFALSQGRPTQSEPEVSHFSVSGGSRDLTADDQEFLSEAVKWSVLFEERETKVKEELQPYPVQWVLNPIYAPYFRITYRKRRKLELTADHLVILIRGTYDERKQLLRSFQKKWDLESPEMLPTLFSHLEAEQHAH